MPTLTFPAAATPVGAAETWQVPSGVRTVAVELVAGSGGTPPSNSSATGGKGAKVTFDLEVTPGEWLIVYPGGAGADANAQIRGSGLGGPGGGTNPECITGGDGGGGSRIGRFNLGPGTVTEISNAGGGGGAGAMSSGGAGGDGGQTGGDGGAGVRPTGSFFATIEPGGGADGSSTVGAGGLGAETPPFWHGTSGSSNGNGGIGGLGGVNDLATWYGGGGGGGGFCGGGGGGGSHSDGFPAGGGGGSSVVTTVGATNIVHTDGHNVGDGWVTLAWRNPTANWSIGMVRGGRG